jgi:hypothetical protein
VIPKHIWWMQGAASLIGYVIGTYHYWRSGGEILERVKIAKRRFSMFFIMLLALILWFLSFRVAWLNTPWLGIPMCVLASYLLPISSNLAVRMPRGS